MTIYRVEHNKNYTVINNTICKDNRLSWKAKGIWLYAFSRPDNWTFHENDLVNQSTDGRDALRSGLKELEDTGYLRRDQNRNNSGQFGDANWTFYETPFKIISPKTENPSTENPTTENLPITNTDLNQDTENNNNRFEPVVVVSSENDDEKRKMLVEFAFDTKTLTHLCTFSLEVISQALEAYRSQLPGKIANKEGYMRNAIENGWKVEKTPNIEDEKNKLFKQINENKSRCTELYEQYKPYIKFKGFLDFKINDLYFEMRPYNGEVQLIPYTEPNCIAILHNYIDNGMKKINNSREIID
jgi:hypothetical protein